MSTSTIPCEEEDNVVPDEEGKIRDLSSSNDSNFDYREGSILLSIKDKFNETGSKL